MKRQSAGKTWVQTILVVGVAGFLATGCKTYEQRNSAVKNWHMGNLTNALTEAQLKVQKNADNKDTIIWQLELGAIQRANGQYEDSNVTFEMAQVKIDDYAAKAKVRVGQETGALLSNQAQLDYEGRSYDGIMLNTYKALNYLELGEPDKARPELIRAYQRQKDAVEDNKKRIEKVQQEAAEAKDKEAISKAENDPKFKEQISGTNYANLNNLKAYTDYVNPFTVYLDGLFFMATATDGSDLERARKSFERVAGFLGDNEYIKADLASVDGLIGGKPLEPTTYVIFETGCAPVRDQVRIDIPIIVSKVSYVGAAFPKLKPHGNFLPSLAVLCGTNAINTTLLCDMDSIVGLDFKNEMPVVITKTIAATVTKAIAAYAINAAAKQQDAMVGLFAQLSTAVYQAAVNIADERTWTTLPKEFQYCRIPTPADRKIELATPNGLQKIPVTIGNGTLNLIYVKSVTANSPLLVTQIKLK